MSTDWIGRPPSAFDIVTCYLPHADGSRPKLRPVLVLKLLRAKEPDADGSRRHACEVAYGTSKLRLAQRAQRDLLVQNSADLDRLGLPVATRFDLDPATRATLPWNDAFFGCWRGRPHPRLGSLTERYVRELAWLLARQTMPPE